MRHHRDLRRTLFIPSNQRGCPIDVHRLGDERVTYYNPGKYEAERGEFCVRDNWRKVANVFLHCQWYGRTEFSVKQSECISSAMPAESDDERTDGFMKRLRATNIPARLLCHVSCDEGGVYNRTIIEYCTSEESRIGRRTKWSQGCRVIRITESLNANSEDGKWLAAKGCASKKSLLFSSIPCTGGSPWMHVVKEQDNGWDIIRAHQKAMKPLLRTFEQLCAIAQSSSSFICIEWPSACTYWKRSDAKRIIKRYSLEPVKLHGCAVGLKAIAGPNAGMPIMKPWTLYTNCPEIIEIFRDRKCDGNHEHAVCRGVNCKATEGYTDVFARCIHKAYSLAVSRC